MRKKIFHTKFFNKIFKKEIYLTKFFKIFKNEISVTIALVFIIWGSMLNSKGGYMWPLVHEIVLSLMLGVQLSAIKYIIVQLDKLKQCTNDNVVLGCLLKYEKYRDAWAVIPTILLGYAFFAFNIYVMNVIPDNILGIYSVILASLTLITGVYGYYQYICLLLCLYNIKSCKLTQFPCSQKWFIKLEKLTRFLSTLFLSLGFGYILEFSILTADYTSNTPQYCTWGLYMVWIGIASFIILAFPTLVVIRRIMLKNIVKKWQTEQTNEANLLICDLIDASASSKNTKSVENQISLYKEKMTSINQLNYNEISGNKFSIGVTSILNILMSILTFVTQINDLLN